MKNAVITMLFLALLHPGYCEQQPLVPEGGGGNPASALSASDAVPAASDEFLWRVESNTAFSTQEKLDFSIHWGLIKVGSASLNIEGVENLRGRDCYRIVARAWSAPFFDTFFKVRDVNESWMDVLSLCSLQFRNNISEGNYKKLETLVLDQQQGVFSIIESGKTGTIPLWVQDVLSAMYYLRTKEISVGKEYSIDAHSGDKSWPLKIRVLRKEKEKVGAGTFECFVVEPSVREDAGIFQAKGKIWVWLTADDRKIPVKMKSKVFVGSISAELSKVKF